MFKKVVVTMFFFVVCQVGVVNAEEYRVVSGDTIGIIADKLNCSVERLAKLNGIKPPEYVVRIGDAIRYVSDKDIRLAQDWIDGYLQTSIPDQAERVVMKMMLHALDAHNIRYDDQRNGGIYADEVLLLADAQEAR